MTTPLVGRQPQLRALVEAFETVGRGEPRLVLVGGVAGMGKSRLVEAFLDQLPDDALVLRTACAELGADGVPLVPVTAAVREMVAVLGLERLAQLVPQARVLVRLLPEYRDSAELSEESFVELFTAVLHRLGRGRPIVWFIDDGHWADRSTRELLGLLARTLRSTRMLLVVTYRDDLPAVHPWRALLAGLVRLPTVSEVTATPLLRAEAVELLDGLSPARVEDLHRRSAGVPFYLLELAAYDGAELPPSLQSVLLGHVAGLGADALTVVRVAAVGSRVVEHELLARVTRLPGERLTAAVREAVAARILEARGTGYQFRHALLRDAVLGELLPVERTSLHRQCAEVLAELPGSGSMELTAEVAIHWLRAGEDDEALPALLAAADAARAMNAYAAEAHLLDHALQLWGDREEVAGHTEVELYPAAMLAGQLAGQYALVLRMAQRGLARPALEKDGGAVARLWAERAMAQHRLGYGDAMASVAEARAALPDGLSVDRHAVLERLSGLCTMQGHPDLARELAEEGRRVAIALEDPVRHAESAMSLAWVFNEIGQPDRAVAALEEVRGVVEASDDVQLRGRFQLNRAIAPYSHGDIAQTLAVLDEGLRLVEGAGVDSALGARLLLERCEAQVLLGRWDEALAGIEQALAADPSHNDAAVGLTLRAEVHLARGDPPAAASQLRAARAMLGELPPLWYLLAHELTLADREDRVDDVRRRIRQAIDVKRGPSMQRWTLVLAAAEAARTRAPGAARGARRPRCDPALRVGHPGRPPRPRGRADRRGRLADGGRRVAADRPPAPHRSLRAGRRPGGAGRR